MTDPVTAAKQREEQDRLPFIYVHEFRKEYIPQQDGSQREVHIIAWGKKGLQNPSITEERADRMKKDPLMWEVLGPVYDRWVAQESSPIDGTPLAAWPGATPQLVKALEPANIRSVQDLARMEDAQIMKLAIPGLRDKQKQARSYLDALVSTASVANENAKLREQVESQTTEIAELRKAIEALAEKDAEPKRRKKEAA